MNARTCCWSAAWLVELAMVFTARPAVATYISSDTRFPAPLYMSTNPVEYSTPSGVFRAGRGNNFFDIFVEPPFDRVALPSSPGAPQVNSFFDVFAEFDLAKLPSPPVHVHAPAPMTTSVTKLNGLPPGEPVFDTEMLQLNISGGTLPPSGVMIRESPTKASTGRHSLTDLGGGLYRIDSFFDVFTELSLDGGQTWTPANSALRVVGVPEPAAAMLLAFGVAAFACIRRRY
jgi:PEP-CTERM motif-containing protein